jgi:transcriptional regulator with XRE-family HTH domain
MNSERFAQLLKEFIGRRGMANLVLAQAIGVSSTTITKWLKGEIKRRFDCEKILKCADVLDLSARERVEWFSSAGCQDYQPVAIEIDLTEPLVPITTRPIIHPHQFFGRLALLDRIFNGWQRISLEHTAVIGAKLSGKTSLLNYVKAINKTKSEHLRNNQRNDWLQKTCNWVMIDFKNDIRTQHLESLIPYLLKKLNLFSQDINALSDFINTICDNLHQPTIILIDNIEAGLKSPGLGQDFWYCLRHLGSNCANGQIGFLITSRQSLTQLEELSLQLNKPSPFFNLFIQHKLGPLTEAEARELIEYTPQRFSKANIDWILEQSQCYPYPLQILCEVRLNAFKAGGDWQKIGLEKIKPYRSSY